MVFRARVGTANCAKARNNMAKEVVTSQGGSYNLEDGAKYKITNVIMTKTSCFVN